MSSLDLDGGFNSVLARLLESVLAAL